MSRCCTMKIRDAFVLVSVALLSVPHIAHADPGALAVSPLADGLATGAMTAAWVASEALVPVIGPSRCRWCVPDGLDAHVRTALVWSSPGVANTLGGLSAFALAPLLAFGGDALASFHDGSLGLWTEDALVIGEATALAVDVDQAVKLSVAREYRNFVIFNWHRSSISRSMNLGYRFDVRTRAGGRPPFFFAARRA